jgi:dTMP kinase
MSGLFITLEGTEGCGKTTQAGRLVERLRLMGYPVCVVREPGGTPIGEEIRQTLKHSQHDMAPETELLLMNACRAQLVREVIRPALARGEIVISDRFYDSTIAYQGYGRQLDLTAVQAIVHCAVGDTHPHLTLFLKVSPGVSAGRLRSRQAGLPPVRDRIEAADREFFERVARGFEAVAAGEPARVKVVDAERSVDEVSAQIWMEVQRLLPKPA